MTHPSDPDRRKKRDAALRDQDQLIAEHLAQAYTSGELQAAESFGKPMADLEGYMETPPEFRMPFKILKNAGVVPPEVELFRKRDELRRRLESAAPGDEKERLRQQLTELEQMLALRLEGMRSTGRL